MTADRVPRHFLRLLVACGRAGLTATGTYRASGRAGTAEAPVAEVRRLASDGLVRLEAEACLPLPEARAWLRRQLVGDAPFAGQHREVKRQADGTDRKTGADVLHRLAQKTSAEAFLLAHQFAAGERVAMLAERARLRSRITMSYDAAAVTGRKGGGSRAGDIGDMAADARRELAAIHALLPRDCAGVVMDVCAHEKGLQDIEAERGWPRRSAKLVLRIGLDRLADQWGMSEGACGPERTHSRSWMQGPRPEQFG